MKKVLIITYYWPPAGGAGVQRALKYVKYLPHFGWEPIVLTVENPDSPIDDRSLLKDIPPGTKVFKTKSLEPFNLYKKFTGKKADSKIPSDILFNKENSSLKEKIANWFRLNLFIPDAKIGWIPFAVREGLKIIERENIEIIFSTSPPHTIQLIGKKLAKKSNVKWVTDFRDPWLELIHYQANSRSSVTKLFESRLEKNVLQKADKIITVSNTIKRMFESKVDRNDVIVIPNGYDDSDVNQEWKNDSTNFVITYTGIISETKIPNELFSACSKLKKEGVNNFKIVFAGKISEECVDSIKKFGLLDHYEFKGYLPHEESVKLLLNSTILLLLIDNIPNNKGILTGKIFEYLGCKKPIFAIGPIDGDANSIIEETNSGAMINYYDNDEAYNLLKIFYEKWKDNNLDYKFNAEQYSRKNQALELSNIFNSLVK